MESTVSVTCFLSFSILMCESYHHGVETASVVQTAEKTFPEKAAGINTDLAGLIQRLHLQELFHRYGENNTLTIEGFRKLLQNIGGNSELQNLGTGEVKSVAHLDLTNATNATDSGNTSWLANGKANESFIFPKELEGGSYLYSKFKNQNTQECSNASKLMQSHGIGTQVWLTATEFSYLCPAIINQIDGKYCIVHATSEKAETPPKGYSLQIAWIGGFISISVISFLSLLGVILVPLMNRVFFKFLLSFLVALAVGTLSGDAFLHLLPHSHGNHHHHREKPLLEQNKGSLFKHLVFQSLEESAYLDSTWKGLTALGGLYFMFLVEHLITLIKQFKDKKKKKRNEDDGESKKFSANEEMLDPDDRPEGYLGTDSQDPSPFISQQPAVQEEEEEVMIAHSHQEEVDNEYVSRGCRNKCHSHLHDTLGQTDHLSHHHHDYHHILHHHHHQNHHPHSHSQRYSREELKDAGIATLAWMVIMGDGLHNFSDGLAIGAAFTEGLSSGLSTSVAVFCHELPHELGDFAVLLKAGMTVKQAVLYNALSAMLAYLGMATGILIGHYADNVSMWIFALTAGLFMYVALVDMVPEMLHNDASDHGCSRWGYFLLQNAGILLGFGIMLLISVFEHKIVFSINL
uniref:Zinc transporter ZIP6 n=1 Tax=Dromaius novaehollandiae TaxID=8790 RepID=A0A8C4K5J8_DRONO